MSQILGIRSRLQGTLKISGNPFNLLTALEKDLTRLLESADITIAVLFQIGWFHIYAAFSVQNLFNRCEQFPKS
jgi:hypothetical protein